jgi:hypothetical protein
MITTPGAAMATATIAWGEPGVFEVAPGRQLFGMQAEILASSTRQGRTVLGSIVGLPVEPLGDQFRVTENEPGLWALHGTDPDALEPFAESVVEEFRPRIQAALQKQQA